MLTGALLKQQIAFSVRRSLSMSARKFPVVGFIKFLINTLLSQRFHSTLRCTLTCAILGIESYEGLPAPLQAEVTKLTAVGAEEEPGTACVVEVGKFTAGAFVDLGAMLTSLVAVDVNVRDATCGLAAELNVFTRRFTGTLCVEIMFGVDTAGLTD